MTVVMADHCLLASRTLYFQYGALSLGLNTEEGGHSIIFDLRSELDVVGVVVGVEEVIRHHSECVINIITSVFKCTIRLNWR